MVRILFLIWVVMGHYCGYSQQKYRIHDAEGFDFVLDVSVKDSIIEGYTRKKALLDYASRFQYGAIKFFSSLQYPEIIRFKATIRKGKFEGKYHFLFSEYKIVGNIEQDSVFYGLYDKNNTLFKHFKGEKVADYQRKDYKSSKEDLIKTTEENIYDPKIVNSKKWQKFKKKMRQNSAVIADDLELQIGFFALIRSFDFSHYYLVKRMQQSVGNEKNFSLEEIDKDIAVLKIRKFSGKKSEMELLVDSIYHKQYQCLIIDLRDNPGGNFETALPLAHFLTDKELVCGFLPNRKWYENNNRLPNESDIADFNLFKEGTMQEFNAQSSSKFGVVIQTQGTKHKFNGRVYFLVNEQTGSTAEALVIGVKEHHLGKIIGKQTAGSLLNAQSFPLDEDMMLLVPTNDFISFKGYRVDKKGIQPDIRIKNQDALEYTIRLIHRDE
ncbi:MAG: S41 family peptidase [Bacteroidota bacterium]|nr:S41 family peptidase [Bacteroidota bacterium]